MLRRLGHTVLFTTVVIWAAAKPVSVGALRLVRPSPWHSVQTNPNLSSLRFYRIDCSVIVTVIIVCSMLGQISMVWILTRTHRFSHFGLSLQQTDFKLINSSVICVLFTIKHLLQYSWS